MSFGGGDVETKLSDVITKNEQLELENALFASYLERVAPSTGAEEDDAPEATPTAKKGKSKVVLPKEVALEQKTELAQQEVDDLKDEIELTKAESEKLLDRLQGAVQESDLNAFGIRCACAVQRSRKRDKAIIDEQIRRCPCIVLRDSENACDCVVVCGAWRAVMS